MSKPKVRTVAEIATVDDRPVVIAIDNDLIRHLFSKENPDGVPANPQPA